MLGFLEDAQASERARHTEADWHEGLCDRAVPAPDRWLPASAGLMHVVSLVLAQVFALRRPRLSQSTSSPQLRPSLPTSGLLPEVRSRDDVQVEEINTLI